MAIQRQPTRRHINGNLVAIALAWLPLAAVRATPVPAGNPASAGAGEATPIRGCGGMGMGMGLGLGLGSADARFIAMMIPHHQGAIAMADLALQRSVRPPIRQLAESIRSGQSRDNAQMRRWYRQWFGTDVPAWSGACPGMAGGGGMAGFTGSLEALRSAADVDRAFLEQMIAHHRMGVMMASHAQWNSRHADLRQLEAAMVRVQSDEIERMTRWLHQWYGSGSP